MTQQSMTEAELKEFLTALSDNCGNKEKMEWYHGLIEDIEIAFTEHVPDAGEMIEEAKSLWQNGNKLEAVKLMCQSGYRLKDAKNYCEKNFYKTENKEIDIWFELRSRFIELEKLTFSERVKGMQELQQQYTLTRK